MQGRETDILHAKAKVDDHMPATAQLTHLTPDVVETFIKKASIIIVYFVWPFPILNASVDESPGHFPAPMRTCLQKVHAVTSD